MVTDVNTVSIQALTKLSGIKFLKNMAEGIANYAFAAYLKVNLAYCNEV